MKYTKSKLPHNISAILLLLLIIYESYTAQTPGYDSLRYLTPNITIHIMVSKQIHIIMVLLHILLNNTQMLHSVGTSFIRSIKGQREW